MANFAENFAAALNRMECQVETATQLGEHDADIVVIQHEFGLFNSSALIRDLAACSTRKLLFAHSPRVEIFEPYIDGYLTMCPGMVRSRKPICVMPHPGWYSEDIPSRQQAKQLLGYQSHAGVIGSNGFMNTTRQFSRIVESLLPWAERENWLINVLCTRHAKHAAYSTYRAEERRLKAIAAGSANVRLDMQLKSHAALALQFRACDLLWCWSSMPSTPYASGTCSDQYCSGTRLVITDKLQHSCLWGQPNVVLAPPDLDGFLAVLSDELQRGNFAQHDGRALSWQSCAALPARFLGVMRAPSLPPDVAWPVLTP